MPKMSTSCKKIRTNVLAASVASGHGHIPTSFSVIEMICAAYDTMKHNPQKPDWADRDIFILSKGHAALGFYAVLAQYGYFPVEELKTFGAFQSRLGCHPDRLKVPGAELSTGSLGHGIGVAVGMALAFKIQNSPRRVFTLIGDGEANEGSVWESIMIASNLQLKNLTVMLDFNHSQARSLQIPNPVDRFKSFGCATLEVDGHDLDALKAAFVAPTGTVKAVVANTVKGFGCSTLAQNVFEWHRKSPKAEEFQSLIKELETA